MGLGLQISLETIEGRVLLRLEGRLDASSSPTLEKKLEQLLKEGHFLLIVDFTGVDYLSSAGLRVLLSSFKKAKAHKGALILCSLHEDVLEIVKMTGFDKILPICSNEKEALQFGK